MRAPTRSRPRPANGPKRTAHHRAELAFSHVLRPVVRITWAERPRHDPTVIIRAQAPVVAVRPRVRDDGRAPVLLDASLQVRKRLARLRARTSRSFWRSRRPGPMTDVFVVSIDVNDRVYSCGLQQHQLVALRQPDGGSAARPTVAVVEPADFTCPPAAPRLEQTHAYPIGRSRCERCDTVRVVPVASRRSPRLSRSGSKGIPVSAPPGAGCATQRRRAASHAAHDGGLGSLPRGG